MTTAIRTVSVLVLMATAACFSRPPESIGPRSATPVSASFDATWEAVIDYFARTNTPVSQLEKDSGFIVASRERIERDDAREWADCGVTAYREFPHARAVKFNVSVRSRGTGSEVLVSAAWEGGTEHVCETTGVFESEMERAVKTMAESR